VQFERRSTLAATITTAEPAVMSKLQELISREEIREVLMRYCRGVDRGDEDIINSTFHPDAIDDHGTPAPPTKLAHLIATDGQQRMHFTGNVLIELEGDTAFVESYFIAFSPHDVSGVPHTRSRAGRYVDRFERRDDEWKIAYRRVIDDWARLDPIGKVPDNIGVHAGSRTREDAVYHMRDTLK
jgi:hypothetical protein